jgi:hypothetical protein
MPGDFRWLAVNTRVHTHYQYAHTRLRVHRAPGIPHALVFSRSEKFRQTSDASRREIANLYRGQAQGAYCGYVITNTEPPHGDDGYKSGLARTNH